MPQNFKKYEDPKLDGRIKIQKSEYKKVVEIYNILKSQRKTAKIFNVDKGTISNIINQERYKRQLERYKKEKHSKKYYDTKYNTISKRKNRLKKRINGHVIIITKPRKYTAEYLKNINN